MQKPVQVDSEAGRLVALKRYQILDTPPEAAFDKVTQLAAELFDLPIAAVSLIDSDRQWFKSLHGLSRTETPRSLAFCSHTIRAGTVIAIEDTTKDHRLAKNPFVTGSPGFRCYLGAPLTSPDGYQMGSLCVAGYEPRRFSSSDSGLILRMAELVVAQMDLRLGPQGQQVSKTLEREEFKAVLSDAFAEFDRTGHPVTLAIIAIDDIKPTKRGFGSLTTQDAYEASIAATSELLRKTDVIGRWSANEFVALLRGADLLTSLDALERLRQGLRSVLSVDGDDTGIGAGIGFVACRRGFLNSEKWFAAAETALVAAQRAGRYQIRTYGKWKGG